MLALGATAVCFVGETADGKDTGQFGALARAERLHGRFVYRGSGLALWWAGGAWFVGDEGDVGGRSGFLMAEDRGARAALIPEDVSGWQMHAKDGWESQPDVKVVAAE